MGETFAILPIGWPTAKFGAVSRELVEKVTIVAREVNVSFARKPSITGLVSCEPVRRNVGGQERPEAAFF
jgi:hypothetical protein